MAAQYSRARPVPAKETCFHLRYQIAAGDGPVIRIFRCRDDAAAFIIGLAGPELRELNERERRRVREYFPDVFGSGDG